MSDTKEIHLGPREIRLLFGLESRNVDLFMLRDAQAVLRAPERATADVLYHLRKKGRVIEVRKGQYLLVPARAGHPGGWSESIFRIVDAAANGAYYVGFWVAMNYWNMTEQLPRTLHVVVPNRRRAFEFQGQRVRFVCMEGRRIFGSVRERLARGAFWVSDRERTVVDGLLFPRYCGGIGEVAKALWTARRDLSWGRLEAYVDRLGVDAVRRRLGYVLDLLRLQAPLRRRLKDEFRGFRWLDPSAPRRALGYSKDWGLALNVGRPEILGWRRS